MSNLQQEVLQALAGKNGIVTVPHLAAEMGVIVNLPLLEALYKLRRERLISWKPGKFMYVSPTGYEALKSIG